MKIKNQFLICIGIFSIVLLVITASAAITDSNVRQLGNQGLLAGKIERSVSSLNSVAIDYFLYQEDVQLSRWKSIHATLDTELSELNPVNPLQQNAIKLIDADLHDLNQTFIEVTSYLQGAPRNVSVRIDPKFQIIWSEMAAKSEKLASDSSQLSSMIDDLTRQTQMTNTLLMLSLVVTFGALLATVFIIVFQRTLKSLQELQKGMNTVGSGNLDYILQTDRQDEISALSQSFNDMATKLKTVTSSKSDLEKEIEERKKVEEALKKSELLSRQKAEELQVLQVKLEEKAAEVEEYASQMEEVASQMEQVAQERLEKLKDAERLAAIGATAGMVGHDIRNPLQAISGDIYLIFKDLVDLPDGELKQSII